MSAGKDINLSVWLTHLSSTHICRVSLEEVWAARFWEVPHKAPLLSLPLSELFPSSSCVCCEEGGTLGQRENWHNSCCWRDWVQASTRRKPSHKNAFPSVWELVTATLELRRFHISIFILTLSPCGCCAAASSCIQKFFKRRRKFF